MDRISRIRDEYPEAVVDKCSENNCGPTLRMAGKPVILKGECMNGGMKMPDCIIFGRNPGHVVGIVEIKGRAAHASEIREKFCNSLGMAMGIRDRHMDKGAPIHLVLVSNGMRHSEYHRFQKPVRFGSTDYFIILRRCGDVFPVPTARKGRR